MWIFYDRFSERTNAIQTFDFFKDMLLVPIYAFLETSVCQIHIAHLTMHTFQKAKSLFWDEYISEDHM